MAARNLVSPDSGQAVLDPARGDAPREDAPGTSAGKRRGRFHTLTVAEVRSLTQDSVEVTFAVPPELQQQVIGAHLKHLRYHRPAQALSQLAVASKSWFGRREPANLPDLEYRTCATSTKAGAKAAAERMIGRRETYMSGAA